MPDLADKAIQYIRQQKSLTPDKPFFTYFAPGATHTPHHVPPEWIERWKGKFDQGWDALRKETFARQKELGVVPADADLTARSEGITAWDDVDDAMKPILARQMEVYAGSSSTPTTTPAASSTPWRSSGSSTTRWCTTSSATTAPRPRADRSARS